MRVSLIAALVYRLATTTCDALDRRIIRDEVGSFAPGDDFWSFYNDLYYPLADLHNAIESAGRQYSGHVDLRVIGRSHQANDIHMLKVRTTGNSGRSVFVECGAHAREWMAPAACMHLLHRLLTFPHDPDVSYLLDYANVYIVPMLNPDGYEYTWTTDRLWRKNRSMNGCARGDYRCCRGVDLNRAFGFHWAAAGESRSRCSDLYAGSRPMAEPEVQAIQSAVTPISHTVSLYVAVHTFGQLVTVPYGWSSQKPPHANWLNYVAKAAARAMTDKYDTVHRYTRIDAHYPEPKAGSSVDWAIGALGIPFAYLIELRPAGVYTTAGFMADAYDVPEAGNELMAGLAAMCKAIKQSGLGR